MSCIRHTLQLHHLPCPDIDYYCSLCAARHIYDFGCNSLDYLCDHFSISYGTHHRAGDDAEMCARLFLQEIKDGNFADVSDLNFCTGKL